MNVGELKKALEKLPEDMEVLTYIGEAEEYGNCGSVTVVDLTTEEARREAPYAKGDKPERKKLVCLLSGWIV